MGTPAVLGIGAVIVALVADQASKLAALVWLFEPRVARNVLPFFDLVPHWNRGISFGLFGSSPITASWIFSVVALVIVGFLAYWMWRARHADTAIAFGLIIGGAVGNVIDRVRFGAVIDFIHVHYGWFDWPVFNLADSFIFVGAVLLIGESLFSWRRAPDKMNER